MEGIHFRNIVRGEKKNKLCTTSLHNQMSSTVLLPLHGLNLFFHSSFHQKSQECFQQSNKIKYKQSTKLKILQLLDCHDSALFSSLCFFDCLLGFGGCFCILQNDNLTRSGDNNTGPENEFNTGKGNLIKQRNRLFP